MEHTGRCSSCFEPKGGPGPCPGCGWDAENPGPQSTQRLKPGTILNGVYTVGKVLGQGGFGITYLAWDTHGSSLLGVETRSSQMEISRCGGEKRWTGKSS